MRKEWIYIIFIKILKYKFQKNILIQLIIVLHNLSN